MPEQAHNRQSRANSATTRRKANQRVGCTQHRKTRKTHTPTKPTSAWDARFLSFFMLQGTQPQRAGVNFVSATAKQTVALG